MKDDLDILIKAYEDQINNQSFISIIYYANGNVA